MTRPSTLAVLVLAAGQGKRMRSVLPKVLHPLYGRPLLSYVLDRAIPLGDVRVVVGHSADQVRAVLPKGTLAVVQKSQLGTGHAVMAARGWLAKHRTVLILSGDSPLLTDATLRRLYEAHRTSGASATILSARLADPAGYGRIVRRPDGTFLRIVEESDATDKERAIHEVNTGTYVFAVPPLLEGLTRLRKANRQNEYYLPDVVTGLLNAPPKDISEPPPVHVMEAAEGEETLGVNSREGLALAHAALRRRKAKELMGNGVTLIAPETFHAAPSVEVGADTVIEPNVLLLGSTRIGKNCHIGMGCRVENSTVGDGVTLKAYTVLEGAVVEKNASAGPFARLRPGTRVEENARVGNFVETKKAVLGRDSKANHLSYLGDVKVGRGVNVGAGTITCNYDGVNKHETVLEDGVFIGSDTQLVAPVRVGRGAYVGAGSTIVRNVPADALALTRVEQKNIVGWAKKKRLKEKPRKKK